MLGKAWCYTMAMVRPGRLQWPQNRISHLIREIDSPLWRGLIILLAIDIVFVAIHLVHDIYIFSYNAGVPMLAKRWNIDTDRSYAEIFGYAKLIGINAAVYSTYKLSNNRLYLIFLGLFIYILLDDSLLIHERLGSMLADASDWVWHRDVGQLAVWIVVGVLLLAVAMLGLARSSGENLSNGVLLLGAVAALGFFAVGVDLIHAIVRSASRIADLLLTAIEELGEQLMLSLTVGLAILIRRSKCRKATVAAP
jgi:hypothetical protein